MKLHIVCGKYSWISTASATTRTNTWLLLTQKMAAWVGDPCVENERGFKIAHLLNVMVAPYVVCPPTDIWLLLFSGSQHYSLSNIEASFGEGASYHVQDGREACHEAVGLFLCYGNLPGSMAAQLVISFRIRLRL